MKIVISLNTSWNLVNFRSGLIRALVAAGHDVVAVAPFDNHASGLKTLGCRYVPLHMDNGGTNPVKDALLTWRYLRLFACEYPDVYLGYTVKPNVYGSLVAHMLHIPVINNIAGLGAVFIKDGWLVRVVRWLYRMALKRSAKVFFQNDDDRKLFISGGLVRAEVTELLPGSGIDLNRFTPALTPAVQDVNSKFRFLMVARMLHDKGVGEFVEAATMLRDHWPQVEWCLLGFLEVENPSAISQSQIDTWVQQGVVRYLGVRDDVRDEIAAADCVVLPSYREGTPRSLLEAAAMARPIITTDAVGCREVVEDGLNGLICEARNSSDLAAKMQAMLKLPVSQRIEMGLRGRQKMEQSFDENIVIGKYMDAINEVTSVKKYDN